MKLNIKEQDKDLLVEVEGRIDHNSADDFGNALANIDENINRLIFDFEKLRYISSAGLRVFVLLNKKIKARNGSIILKNVNDLVFTSFDSTGMTVFFEIER